MSKSNWLKIGLALAGIAGAYFAGKGQTPEPQVIDKTNDTLFTAYVQVLQNNKELETQRDAWRKQAQVAQVEIAKKNEIISHTKPETTIVDGTVFIHDTVKIQSADILAFSFPSKTFPWLEVAGFAYEGENKVEGEVYSTRKMWLGQDNWFAELDFKLFGSPRVMLYREIGNWSYGIGASLGGNWSNVKIVPHIGIGRFF